MVVQIDVYRVAAENVAQCRLSDRDRARGSRGDEDDRDSDSQRVFSHAGREQNLDCARQWDPCSPLDRNSRPIGSAARHSDGETDPDAAPEADRYAAAEADCDGYAIDHRHNFSDADNDGYDDRNANTHRYAAHRYANADGNGHSDANADRNNRPAADNTDTGKYANSIGHANVRRHAHRADDCDGHADWQSISYCGITCQWPASVAPRFSNCERGQSERWECRLFACQRWLCGGRSGSAFTGAISLACSRRFLPLYPALLRRARPVQVDDL